MDPVRSTSGARGRPALATLRARRHKNSRLAYFVRNFGRLALPRAWHRAVGRGLLAGGEPLPPEVADRLAYYYRVPGPFELGPDADALPLSKLDRQRNYWFDLAEHLRRMPAGLRVHYRFGDGTDPPSVPTLVKARRVGEVEGTSVLFKLNKIRHYVFARDAVRFEAKQDRVVWRGKAPQPERQRFLERWHAHPLVDAGRTEKRGEPLHAAMRLSIDEQLRYKFVLSLEGYDVASNLKWVLSSNSVCLMPRPTKETWFMEGALEPGVHYVALRDDLEDLAEQVERWSRDPEGCRRIVRNANAWVDRFRDRRTEDLLALLVLHRYSRDSGQRVD